MAPSLPMVNWYKLNTNGSFLGNPGKARGGLACAIRSTSSVIAELQALRDGLSLFNQFHIQSLNIELDASMIINLLCNNNRFSRTLSPLIDDCRVLLIRFTRFSTAFRRLIGVLTLRLGCLLILFLLSFPFLYFGSNQDLCLGCCLRRCCSSSAITLQSLL